MLEIEGTGNRQWLTRARSDLKFRVIKKFARGDDLIEIKISVHERRQNPSQPQTWQVRAIRYRRKGLFAAALVHLLRDPMNIQQQRSRTSTTSGWELELGHDEIKTELLERHETIRSRNPGGVRQELWGILLAYNLVRLEMARIAAEADVEPTRISFVEALRLIHDEWEWLSVTSPGAIPKRLEALRRNIKRYVVPPRRPRCFPRAIKINMSSYDRKRPEAESAN